MPQKTSTRCKKEEGEDETGKRTPEDFFKGIADGSMQIGTSKGAVKEKVLAIFVHMTGKESSAEFVSLSMVAYGLYGETAFPLSKLVREALMDETVQHTLEVLLRGNLGDNDHGTYKLTKRTVQILQMFISVYYRQHPQAARIDNVFTKLLSYDFHTAWGKNNANAIPQNMMFADRVLSLMEDCRMTVEKDAREAMMDRIKTYCTKTELLEEDYKNLELGLHISTTLMARAGDITFDEKNLLKDLGVNHETSVKKIVGPRTYHAYVEKRKDALEGMARRGELGASPAAKKIVEKIIVFGMKREAQLKAAMYSSNLKPEKSGLHGGLILKPAPAISELKALYPDDDEYGKANDQIYNVLRQIYAGVIPLQKVDTTLEALVTQLKVQREVKGPGGVAVMQTFEIPLKSIKDVLSVFRQNCTKVLHQLVTSNMVLATNKRSDQDEVAFKDFLSHVLTEHTDYTDEEDLSGEGKLYEFTPYADCPIDDETGDMIVCIFTKVANSAFMNRMIGMWVLQLFDPSDMFKSLQGNLNDFLIEKISTTSDALALLVQDLFFVICNAVSSPYATSRKKFDKCFENPLVPGILISLEFNTKDTAVVDVEKETTHEEEEASDEEPPIPRAGPANGQKYPLRASTREDGSSGDSVHEEDEDEYEEKEVDTENESEDMEAETEDGEIDPVDAPAKKTKQSGLSDLHAITFIAEELHKEITHANGNKDTSRILNAISRELCRVMSLEEADITDPKFILEKADTPYTALKILRQTVVKPLKEFNFASKLIMHIVSSEKFDEDENLLGAIMTQACDNICKSKKLKKPVGYRMVDLQMACGSTKRKAATRKGGKANKKGRTTRTASPDPTQGETATLEDTGRAASPDPTQGETASPDPTQGETATLEDTATNLSTLANAALADAAASAAQ